MAGAQPASPLPPHAPGPQQTAWRCRHCGRTLGVIDAPWLFLRHKGRTITAALPARVRCEDCGRESVAGTQVALDNAQGRV